MWECREYNPSQYNNYIYNKKIKQQGELYGSAAFLMRSVDQKFSKLLNP